jgi:hypothetical protein
VIFLSNRNHPTEAGSVGALRHQLGTLAGEAQSVIDKHGKSIPAKIGGAKIQSQ